MESRLQPAWLTNVGRLCGFAKATSSITDNLDLELDVWCLELLWSLVLGSWSFFNQTKDENEFLTFLDRRVVLFSGWVQ